MKNCANCSRVNKKFSNIYCSNECQNDYQYKSYIKKWKNGDVSGNRGVSTRNISEHVKRYLRDKYNSSCSICQWNEINRSTGISPLEIDHVDGNSENSTESNLRLLCPNCHSLTPNYKNLNSGNGRTWRKNKYLKS